MRPTSVVTTMPNAPSPSSRWLFGARGAALAYACACASSAVAIGGAMRAIRAGWIDVAIVGGSEAMLTPGVLASWQAMRVLVPLGASASDAAAVAAVLPAVRRRARNGFALGEAAAAFVLESPAHAAARGARPYRRLLAGYATNCDGVHITQPDATGQARAMSAALADAGLVGRATSATSTPTARRRPAGDAARAGVDRSGVRRRGGVRGQLEPRRSTAHLLGAAARSELLAALRALRAGAPAADGERRRPRDPAFAIDRGAVRARHASRRPAAR